MEGDDDGSSERGGLHIELPKESLVPIWFFLVFCCMACCWRCCGDRSGPRPDGAAVLTVQVDGEEHSVEHLRRRKTVSTAYMLWLMGGLLGAHHFYLDRVLHGVLALWSLNFLGLGYTFDLMFIPRYVSIFNRDVAAAAPLPPGGACRLLAKALLFLTLYFGLCSLAFSKVPRSLHNMGVTDLDKRMAQTAANPFEILGVERGADREDIERAFKELKRCGAHPRQPCRSNMTELRKAYTFATKDWSQRASNRTQRREQPKKAVKSDDLNNAFKQHVGGRGKQKAKPGRSRSRSRDSQDDDSEEDKSWDDWSGFVGSEWKALGQIVKESAQQWAESFESAFDSDGGAGMDSDEL
jgi:TM2 domain-containing membrane protein YozV